MPIIVKPLSDNNSPGRTNPVDRRSDGFDPLLPYQMIPHGATREMVVQTGDFKAEMDFTKPDISSMSNFRILRQTRPNLTQLPGPGVPVKRIVLPERSVIQFTLAGRAQGITVLEGRDRPGLNAPLLKPDVNLRVSVKGPVTRRVAVCYVFDRINRDTGERGDFAGHLANAHNIFHEQANFTILNVDGSSANTQAARTITLDRTMGKVFHIDDNQLVGRVISAFESKFPGVFVQADAVLFSLPVPLRQKADPKNRILGINLRMNQTSTGRKFNTLFVGPQALRPSPKQGGARLTALQVLRNTIAHELGHGLGLKHDPGEIRDLPPEVLGKGKNAQVNPEFFKPIFHNLMFPTALIVSDRINGAQVEILHQFRPPFRTRDF